MSVLDICPRAFEEIFQEVAKDFDSSFVPRKLRDVTVIDLGFQPFWTKVKLPPTCLHISELAIMECYQQKTILV